MNVYGYVSNAPVDLWDPLGLVDHWHHMLPKAFEADFILAGIIDIHDARFGLILERSNHQALHSAGWNNEWKKFFSSASAPRSKAEVLAQLEKMKASPVFAQLLARGRAARVCYGVWRNLRKAAIVARRTARAARRAVRPARMLPGLNTAVGLASWGLSVKEKGWFWGSVDAALDSTPLLGAAKAAAETYAGEDLIEGDEETCEDIDAD
jgi:hypothetical protein